MQTTFGRHFLCLASALVAVAPVAGQCAPAQRGSAAHQPVASQDAPTEEVRVVDLDLRHPADRKILKQRIHQAAIRVCKFDDFVSTACVDVASVEAQNQAHRLELANESIGATVATALVVTGAR